MFEGLPGSLGITSTGGIGDYKERRSEVVSVNSTTADCWCDDDDKYYELGCFA
jgi:hypothetical protein